MFHVFIVHKIPSHSSKDEFEAKVEALVDEALLLPVVKNNLVKCEMIFQNDMADEHVGAFGFPLREPLVFVTLHSETPDALFEVLAAPEVRKIFAKGREWGLHDCSSGFSATVATKVDGPTPPNSLHLICVYNVPPELSTDEHNKKLEDFIDSFVEVLAVKKNWARFEMWQSNNLLEDHVQAFGYSASGPTFIHHARLENLDNALEMLKDPAAHKSVHESGNNGEHFDLKKNGYVFSGRVVTKIGRLI
ncbi:hypothetical protein K438DRAFT_2012390 [Mycena galopus ATCC 62051]|nr:hypothetical protein K438DRAFT_2012390 [Mycena galopus ATCC 62051]